MSSRNGEVVDFLKVLGNLVLNGELPPDETPLTGAPAPQAHVRQAPQPSHPQVPHGAIVLEAELVTCARCDGEGKILKGGQVHPCPGEGQGRGPCAFRTR